jgi:hypothetical protein
LKPFPSRTLKFDRERSQRTPICSGCGNIGKSVNYRQPYDNQPDLPRSLLASTILTFSEFNLHRNIRGKGVLLLKRPGQPRTPCDFLKLEPQKINQHRSTLLKNCPVVGSAAARLMHNRGQTAVLRGKVVRKIINNQATQCQLNHDNRRFYLPAPSMLRGAGLHQIRDLGGFPEGHVCHRPLCQADRRLAG